MEFAIEATRWFLIVAQVGGGIKLLTNAEKAGEAIFYLLWFAWIIFAIYNL